MDLQRNDVLAAFADGLHAVARAAAGVLDWSASTPCVRWRAVDLAGHLLAIAGYYSRLLDAAAAGRPSTGLPRGIDLQNMNDRDLAALPDASGPERIATFLSLARDYGHRLEAADWQQVLGQWNGLGPLTLAEHTGLAVIEWHLHAWDLARSAGHDHRPADPATVAAGRAVLPEPLPAGDPWLATLTWAGRVPTTPSPP